MEIDLVFIVLTYNENVPIPDASHSCREYSPWPLGKED